MQHFLLKQQKLYACGNNYSDRLGLNDESLVYETIVPPVLISQLSDVVDAQSSFFGIVLCRSNNKQTGMILNYWFRLLRLPVPDDFTFVIMTFSKFSKVYTNAYRGHALGAAYDAYHRLGWKEIESLSDKDIVQIVAGAGYSLYLGSDGIVYGCGCNDVGELGNGDKNEVYIPKEIKYFKENNINIIDIATGYGHSLALDSDNNIYSWGYNSDGQCGDGCNENLIVPKIIESLKEYKIDLIRCGYLMSYCRSICGKHFIWGSNTYNECLTYDGKKTVCTPYRIDNIIKDKCDTTRIIDIYPGRDSTKIICE